MHTLLYSQQLLASLLGVLEIILWTGKTRHLPGRLCACLQSVGGGCLHLLHTPCFLLYPRLAHHTFRTLPLRLVSKLPDGTTAHQTVVSTHTYAQAEKALLHSLLNALGRKGEERRGEEGGESFETGLVYGCMACAFPHYHPHHHPHPTLNMCWKSVKAWRDMALDCGQGRDAPPPHPGPRHAHCYGRKFPDREGRISQTWRHL